MRLSKNYFLNFRIITIASCFVFCALNSAQAQTPEDNDKIWTAIGSDGTVDEADISKVFFDRSVVQMGRPLVIVNSPAANPAKANVPAAQKPAIILPQQSQSAVIRYNVTPVDGLFAPTKRTQPGSNGFGPQLKLRYLAEGSSAQVAAKLIEVDLTTGVETERLLFNSNNPPAAAAKGYQVKDGLADCGGSFDFIRKAYYIEVTLTVSSLVVNSAAGIQMIKIVTGICLS